MEIVPGIHALRVIGAKAHLIVSDEITLIDAGHRGSGRSVKRYLERIGRSEREITRIVCTHGHPDHIGGVAEIAAASGAAIYLHPADAARLRMGFRDVLADRTPGQILAFLTRAISDPRPLVHGDVLPVLGGLQVIHTPGHTPGSICLYSPATRVLFSGDVLQMRRGQLAPPHQVFSDDLDEARRSLARLAELDVAVICFAHYPPLRGDATSALRGLMEAWV